MSRYGPQISTYAEFSCFQRKPLSYPWDSRYVVKAMVDPQRRLDYVPDISDVMNDYGCIRWFKIRELYFNGLVDLDFCVDAFREWRDTREDLWLDAIGVNGDIIGSVFVVAAKRGNQWYKDRLNQKFGFFEELPPIHFFCEEWGRKSTPMLFVTLTVDPEFVNNDLDQAWDQISMELHLFETKLRQEFGRFVKLRVWEAHASGYPHCHVVYYFLNRQFEVWEHFDKKKGKLTGNRTWRVSNGVRDKIQGFWNLSKPVKIVDGITKRVPSVDIQGVSDTIGALSEVHKYVTKTIWNKKGDLTSTLCSLHNKQVYWLSQCDYVKKRDKDEIFNALKTVDEKAGYLASVVKKWASKDFVGAIWGSDAYMDFYKRLHEKGFDEGLAEPSLSALVKPTLCNCNKEHPDFDHFEFKGAFLHCDLVESLKLSDDFSCEVKPPPAEIRLLFGVDRIDVSGRRSSRRGLFVDRDGD